MKLVNFLAICIVVSILTGCLYGQCMNGACSLERENLIRSIKPAISYWEKSGVDEVERKTDSKLCSAVHNPPEMNYPAWEKCMLGKGYKYTGECKSEVMKKRPACGAP